MQEEILFISLQEIIKKAKKIASIAPADSEFQNKELIGPIEAYLFGNMIRNFDINLAREEVLQEFKISKEEAKKISTRFRKLFKTSISILKDEDNMNSIREDDYKQFKNELKKISDNAFKLLCGLEELVEYDRCLETLNKFKNEVKKLGKTFKIKKDDDNLRITVSWE